MNKLQAHSSENTDLSMPCIVQNDGRVGMVAKENWHERGDKFMAQGVPGRVDLQ